MNVIKKAKEFFTKFKGKNQFLAGALILAGAGVLCRVLGVVFRIPLTNIVGNFGMGLYQMVFPLYSLLLIVSSAGVPVAISKMVAKEKVNENFGACKKILWNAVVLLGIIGMVFTVLLLSLSGAIAKLQGNKDVSIIYLAIAPSVFFVCLISAFRGYFQGLQNMIPTAVSQIVEQTVKMAVGVTLAAILIKINVVWSVFGAIIAVTASEIVALAYLAIVYIFAHKKMPKPKPVERNLEMHSDELKVAETTTQKEKVVKKFGLEKKLMKEILRQSLPITAMASIFPLILVFDSLVIINLLKAGGQTSKAATQLFGIQSGAVHTLINLPAVIGVAVATAVVPTISSLIKQKKDKELRTKSAMAIRFIFLISIFFVIFYMFFARYIIDLLYHNAFKDNVAHFKTACALLRIESAMIVLMCLSQVFTAMLQAGDKARYPLIALAIGGAVKIIFELAFITTKMGIYAVSISNVICFAIAAAINTFFALRLYKIKGSLWTMLARLGILVALFTGLMWLLSILLPENRWWILLGGVAALAVYGVLVYALKLISHVKNVDK